MSHKNVAFSSSGFFFLTVLSQTWLDRNLKLVASTVKGKIKTSRSKGEKIYTKTFHASFNCVYIYLRGKAVTLHEDLLSALFIGIIN